MGWFSKKNPWKTDGEKPYYRNDIASGEEWSLYNPNKLKYTGPKELMPSSTSINKEAIYRLPEPEMSLKEWIGIIPKLPTRDDLDFIGNSFFDCAIMNKVWLVTLPSGHTRFNCHGNSIFYDFKETLKLVAYNGGAEEKFVSLGYERIEFKKNKTIPRSAKIAYFSGGHSARKSNFRYKGVRLWESKLGTHGPRILHYLKDISCESGAYGEISHFYK